MTSNQCELPITVSEVRIRMAETDDKYLIGWASCLVNKALRLNSISIRKSKTGEMVLVFPCRKSKGDAEYYYFNPISQEVLDEMKRIILEKLEVVRH